MTAPARPDADTLRKYNRGLLSPQEVAAVEAWMAENSQAADLLDEAAGRDSVIDALNDTGASGETPAGTNVQQVRPKVEMALPTKAREFEITGLIGQGGMGAVYAARDTILNRSVAVKLIAAEFAAHAAARERFLREAQAVARIDHPNVVPVHSSGEDRGQLFLVMPLLKGETLEARLKRERKLPPAEVARIGREVAAGLEAAHAVGLIHRDIKPGNIWLEADTGRVRILDFGLAKPLTDATAGLTETGVIVGTPFYMAPEQAEGHLVDGRTDLFSLGAVLYHAATGHRPFKGDTALAVLVSVKADTPPSADSLVTDLPPHLASVIHKLLAKTAADRPTTATEVIESLSGVTAAPASPFAALGEPGEIVRPKPAPAKKLPTRWKRAATAAGLVFATVALAVIVVIIYDKDGKEVARINVPEGKSAKIQPGGDGKGAGPKDAPAVTDPDREAAKYVLSVGGWVRVDSKGRDLRKLADLPKEPFRLTYVWLEWNDRITDDGLAVFQNCKDIEWLNLGAREKEVSGVTDKGLAHFKNCTKLEYLILIRCGKITNAGLANFMGCTRLRRINLDLTEIGNEGLAHLKNCTELECVGLSYTKVSDDGMETVRHWKKLVGLNLTRTRGAVTDTALAYLKDHQSLRALDLDATQITDKGLSSLEGYSRLRVLEVRDTRASVAGVKAFVEKRPHCSVRYSGGTEEPKLWADRYQAEFVLSVGGRIRVNDETRDTLTLADLPKEPFRLTWVKLGHGPRAIEDNFGYGRCENLKHLDLSDTNFSDRALSWIQGFPNLAYLNVSKSAVSAAGVEELKTALPRCRIVWDGGVIDPSQK